MTLSSSLVKSTVVAALGGLLFGFDTAVIAGTTSALTRTFALSPSGLGLTVASALIGTVLGAMLGGWPGDRFGRRDSLRLMAVLYLVSALGCAVAWDWNALVVFRFIGGLGIGGSSVLGPMYIAEIAPARWRGRLVGFFQFNVVVGILLAYFSNYVIGTLGFGDAEWRWKLGVSAMPAALFLVTLFGIPRSPRWLVKKGRLSEARAVLEAIGEEQVETEVRDIAASVELESGVRQPLIVFAPRVYGAICGGLAGGLVGYLLRPAAPVIGQLPFSMVLTRGAYLGGLDTALLPTAKMSFNYLLAGVLGGTALGFAIPRLSRRKSTQPLVATQFGKPIFLAVSIAMFNQLSGINAILYYLNDIFAHAGFSKVSGDLQAVFIGFTNLLATILAMSIIDKAGRKTLLLIGSVGTTLCMGGVAYIFHAGGHEGMLVWLLVGFIGSFSFSQGAVIWVYLSEVFPTNVRAKGQSLGSFTHWFMNAGISWTFPIIAASSKAAPFVFFASMMAIQFFVVLAFYPETKGITLEDMQKKLGGAAMPVRRAT